MAIVWQTRRTIAARLLFDAPGRNELVKRVSLLSEHDPSRMTLKALLHASDRSPAALEHIDAAISLVTGIMQSTDARALASLGLDRYSTRMLNCMWMALDEIRATLVDPVRLPDDTDVAYAPRHAAVV